MGHARDIDIDIDIYIYIDIDRYRSTPLTPIHNRYTVYIHIIIIKCTW